MSETDSDLDFQSADEDNEFDTIPKSTNTAQKCESEEKPTSIKTYEVKDQKHNKNVNEVFKNASDNDDPSNKPVEIPLSELAIDETSEVSKANTNLTQSSNNVEKSENDVDKNNLMTSQNKNDKRLDLDNVEKENFDIPSAEGVVKSVPETSGSETLQEKQRVVLRLEKKIHQKSQTSKEAPLLQKEKASDFINILEDPYKDQQSSWGFSSWGSSLLSSAASSVSTFSSQVSQGIGTVIETVESSLGAPDPEELARTLKERKEEEKDVDASIKDDSQADAKMGLLPNVSSWTKVFENTGSKVIMGGLDTLEFIGKKTMTILTEGDPGLRKKRSAFNAGIHLSEMLREAKARAEQDQKNDPDSTDNMHYSLFFDENQGLVHLEALEMLSKLNEAKFQRLLMRHSKNVEVKKKVEEIKSICENIPSFDDPSDCENFDDFETVFKKHSIELSLPLNVENIIKSQRKIHDSICKYEDLSDDSLSTPKEIFQSAICSLAEFTAKSIETFHKIAELILVQPRLHQDIEHCATNLTGLTTVMCIEINNLSSRYHKCLDASSEHLKKSSSENVDTTILATNLYVEASNSNNYIQDAYQMIIPILQVCVLEALE